MKKHIIKVVIVLSLFAINFSYAQSLKFSRIPHPLTWTNKPISYKINPGSIFIEAGEKTDMFRDPNVT